jgi:hypothetical protein
VGESFRTLRFFSGLLRFFAREAVRTSSSSSAAPSFSSSARLRNNNSGSRSGSDVRVHKRVLKLERTDWFAISRRPLVGYFLRRRLNNISSAKNDRNKGRRSKVVRWGKRKGRRRRKTLRRAAELPRELRTAKFRKRKRYRNPQRKRSWQKQTTVAAVPLLRAWRSLQLRVPRAQAEAEAAQQSTRTRTTAPDACQLTNT